MNGEERIEWEEWDGVFVGEAELVLRRCETKVGCTFDVFASFGCRG